MEYFPSCEETDCPKSKDGLGHCIHWYEAEECCWCYDPKCPNCIDNVCIADVIQK